MLINQARQRGLVTPAKRFDYTQIVGAVTCVAPESFATSVMPSIEALGTAFMPGGALSLTRGPDYRHKSA